MASEYSAILLINTFVSVVVLVLIILKTLRSLTLKGSGCILLIENGIMGG
jgi:hypothetical protein